VVRRAPTVKNLDSRQERGVAALQQGETRVRVQNVSLTHIKMMVKLPAGRRRLLQEEDKAETWSEKGE